MQAEVIAAIETVRARRVQYEREQLLRKRLQILFDAFSAEIPHAHPGEAGRRLIPTIHDIAQWPRINDIINSDDAVRVTLDTFIATRTMDEHIEDWCIEAEAQLATTVRSLLDLPDDVNPFDLACTVLSCNRCNCHSYSGVLYHPEIIYHQCFHHCHDRYQPEGTMLEKICHDLDSEASLWSPDGLCLSKRFKVAREVIIACGQDPKIATVRQMDALDVRLSCKACQLFNPNMCIALTWRAAVSYFALHAKIYHLTRVAQISHLSETCIRKKPKTNNWIRLSPQRLAQAKDIEKTASEYYQRRRDDRFQWWCAHCNIRSQWASKRGIWYHLETVYVLYQYV